MIDIKQSENNNENTINPVIAGVAGAAVGAGIAVAATAVLKDEKTRRKVTGVLHTVKILALSYMDKLKTQISEKQGKVHETIDEWKSK